jgi:hypothetical protein
MKSFMIKNIFIVLKKIIFYIIFENKYPLNFEFYFINIINLNFAI